MCAYNRVNGVPNCADYNLLTKTARGEWGFHGYITSDCDAVSIIRDNHKYARLPEDAVADVLKAGMDVNCGSYLKNYTKSAIQQKKLAESQVDRALHNLFAVRMRLGLFNGNPNQHLFGNIGPDQVCTKEHQQLALEAARNGIVLLKNSNKLLPFSKSQTSSLAVIGPNAHNAYALLGNYEGPPCKSLEIDKVLQGYVKNTLYHKGCNAVNCTFAAIGDAVKIAKQADRVVLVMGLDQSQETEDHDRVDLTLPGQQESLIRAVAAASKKPVVLVLVCGGPVDVSFAKDDPKIGSILWAGYPGEAGAIAIAEIIFGEHNPGGKLPVTWYPKDFITVPMTDMRMRPQPSSGYPGRTYRFYKGPKVFEFGYGLSFSTYSYEHGRPSNGRPVKQLVGFESVSLNARERAKVEFVLSPCEHLSTANEDGVMVIEEGYRHLVVEDREYPINVGRIRIPRRSHYARSLAALTGRVYHVLFLISLQHHAQSCPKLLGINPLSLTYERHSQFVRYQPDVVDLQSSSFGLFRTEVRKDNSDRLRLRKLKTPLLVFTKTKAWTKQRATHKEIPKPYASKDPHLGCHSRRTRKPGEHRTQRGTEQHKVERPSLATHSEKEAHTKSQRKLELVIEGDKRESSGNVAAGGISRE
ncbi:hypothetical protein DH2020_007738 [Rehmannia glutinosa]|uniref:Fibronectin type III-like domain-containing protein n=1 Tax=Rehmannia glutinosa TaxID=99300 RepID=A0ABR0TZC1_REHGL